MLTQRGMLRTKEGVSLSSMTALRPSFGVCGHEFCRGNQVGLAIAYVRIARGSLIA